MFIVPLPLILALQRSAMCFHSIDYMSLLTERHASVLYVAINILLLRSKEFSALCAFRAQPLQHSNSPTPNYLLETCFVATRDIISLHLDELKNCYTFQTSERHPQSYAFAKSEKDHGCKS